MYNLVTENDITKEKEVARLEMWRVLYDMDEKARRIKEMNERLEQLGEEGKRENCFLCRV